MPSVSKKQHNLMEMVAHNPAKAKELKIPQSVAKDFVAADKGHTFKKGGTIMNKKDPLDHQPRNKTGTDDPGMLRKLFKGKESYKEELAEGRAIKSGKITPEQYAKGEKMEEGMCGGGKVKKMASGGKITSSFRSAANGVAERGKTRGKMVSMKGSGE